MCIFNFVQQIKVLLTYFYLEMMLCQFPFFSRVKKVLATGHQSNVRGDVWRSAGQCFRSLLLTDGQHSLQVQSREPQCYRARIFLGKSDASGVCPTDTASGWAGVPGCVDRWGQKLLQNVCFLYSS